jgi:hypothetical protein
VVNGTGDASYEKVDEVVEGEIGVASELAIGGWKANGEGALQIIAAEFPTTPCHCFLVASDSAMY